MSNSAPVILLVILYGGSPTEHEISKVSGNTIYEGALKKYSPIELVGITQNGEWLLQDSENVKFENPQAAFPSALSVTGTPIEPFKYLQQLKDRFDNDVVIFPALHGPAGEDGTLQSRLQKAGIAFVGADAQVSRICIDKLATKKILSRAGISVTPHFSLSAKKLASKNLLSYISKKLDKMPDWELPIIIKPASLGSSVGVHLIKRLEDLESIQKELLELDVENFIIEKYIRGQEIECSVLENPPGAKDRYFVSTPGEIVNHSGVYDYNEKYLDNSAKLIAPAEISDDLEIKFQELSIEVAQAVGIQGLARVDFLMSAEPQKIFVNEINTMPGFTKISMYPRLLELENIGIEDLLERLVELALARI